MAEDEIKSLSQLSDQIRAATTGDKVSAGEVVDCIGKRSLHPLLLVPALLAASPLSGIPGLSSICGLAIAAISFQLVMSYDEVRLPRFVTKRSVDSDAMRTALDKVRPVLAWVDRRTTAGRLGGLFRRPLGYIPEILSLISGLVMPFLEFIPFSASILASGVLLLALSKLTQDGLFFIVALIPYAAFIYVVAT